MFFSRALCVYIYILKKKNGPCFFFPPGAGAFAAEALDEAAGDPEVVLGQHGAVLHPQHLGAGLPWPRQAGPGPPGRAEGRGFVAYGPKMEKVVFFLGLMLKPQVRPHEGLSKGFIRAPLLLPLSPPSPHDLKPVMDVTGHAKQKTPTCP